MKLSVITVVYNNASYIEDCIMSVESQVYQGVEHIVIDGGSTDGTLDIVKGHEGGISKLVSEPDKGIYDAMNKGIALATGDVVGFLNSDDVYADEGVLSDIARAFMDFGVDSCYGDLEYVGSADINKVVRRWKSGALEENGFDNGWHPPHPTFYVKKAVYEKYGGFNLKYSIAADYELMLRLLKKHGISAHYIERPLVKMRVGGKSNQSVSNIIRANFECYTAWKDNDLSVSPSIILRKPLSKIGQFFS